MAKPSREDMAVAQIDQNLRRIFAEDAEADLSPKLMALLEKLDDVPIPEPSGRAQETTLAGDGA